jgi:hypothetical protein
LFFSSSSIFRNISLSKSELRLTKKMFFEK